MQHVAYTRAYIPAGSRSIRWPSTNSAQRESQGDQERRLWRRQQSLAPSPKQRREQSMDFPLEGSHHQERTQHQHWTATLHRGGPSAWSGGRVLPDAVGGQDPKKERDDRILGQQIAQGKAKTVRQVVEEYFKAKLSRSPLDTRRGARRLLNMVNKTIGDMPNREGDRKIILDKVGVDGHEQGGGTGKALDNKASYRSKAPHKSNSHKCSVGPSILILRRTKPGGLAAPAKPTAEKQ